MILTCYEDSETDGVGDSYFAISTTLSPGEAIEVFDRFCEWWDEETDRDEHLSLIHPTLEHHKPGWTSRNSTGLISNE